MDCSPRRSLAWEPGNPSPYLAQTFELEYEIFFCLLTNLCKDVLVDDGFIFFTCRASLMMGGRHGKRYVVNISYWIGSDTWIYEKIIELWMWIWKLWCLCRWGRDVKTNGKCLKIEWQVQRKHTSRRWGLIQPLSKRMKTKAKLWTDQSLQIPTLQLHIQLYLFYSTFP